MGSCSLEKGKNAEGVILPMYDSWAAAEDAADCHDCGALSIVYYDEYAMGNPLESCPWHFYSNNDSTKK